MLNGIEACALVDSGSMVTTISEDFYQSLTPLPTLLSLDDFNLSVQAAGGHTLPYSGYIECILQVPFLGNQNIEVPLLVVPSTEYTLKVPIVIGTNVIKYCRNLCPNDTAIPKEWNNAFVSFEQSRVGVVKTTDDFSIRIQPMQTVNVSGFVRKTKNVESAVTEPTEGASSKIGVCPRIVSLDKVGNSQRVQVRIFNMSAKVLDIKPRSDICELHDVKILRSINPLTETERIAQAAQQSVTDSHNNNTKTSVEGINLETSTLTDQQKERATEFFNKWEHIFSTSLTDIGRTNLVEHRIQLNNEEPFKEPYRRIPPSIFQEVREHLQELLKTNIIRESESPYSSNVVVVRKKDRSIRLCVDFRKLNDRTIKDAYAIPRVEDSLHILAGAKFFSKLDLRCGYWQVELKEDDKHKTAFQVGTLGFFEFNKMPFGLCNAPATFQRLMERCMGDMNLRDCLIYLDDIIIFSSSFEDHLDKLQAVFQRLHESNLKLKANKCEFFKREISYLGHIVSKDGIKTDNNKTEAVRTWPIPKSVKEVRQFLGFTGYYRRFIEGYAAIARPLNDLLVGNPATTAEKKKKNRKTRNRGTPFEWGPQQQKAFETLIQKLTNPPVLAYADYRLPFKLHTDASRSGLGAVLYQQQDSRDRVVAYASRSLKPAEKNYPAHKLEFLALKWAVTDKFHDYLYGTRFEVMTDNNPLTYVLTSAKLDATGQRWIASLSNYNFSLTYRSGTQNADADGLSRVINPTECENVSFPEVLKAIVNSVSIDVEDRPLAESLVTSKSSFSVPDDAEIPESLIQSTALSSYDWIKAQQNDPAISRIIGCVKEGLKPATKEAEKHNIDKRYLRDWDKFVIEDDILFRHASVEGHDCKQLVLPRTLRELVFQSYHNDLGHQGRNRTLSLLKRRFFWPGMDAFVEENIKKCGRCIRRKISPTKAAELVSITSSTPMELVCIDYLSLEKSKGGHENILVITDHFSRYAQAIPTRNQTARTTARVLFDNFFVHYGFPAKLHSDKGANFESKVIKNLCKITGMRKTRTTPYHPMGNGMVERFNKTLLNMLGTLKTPQKADWKSHVPTLCHAYNAATHDSTGYVPFYLMFGRHPRLAVDAFLGLRSSNDKAKSHEDYASKLKGRLAFAYDAASKEAGRNAARQKFHYDLQVRHASLEPGDRVLVRNVGLKGKQKLADHWEHSPYIVKRQPMEGIPVYEVYKENSNSPKTRLLHRNMLLPFMGLPCQDTCEEHKSYDEDKNKRIRRGIKEVPASDSSDDSSQTSSGDESTEPQTTPQKSPKYVIPMRRQKTHSGLLPHAVENRHSSENDDENKAPRRGCRQRKVPERFQAGFINVKEHCFEVPAEQVTYL